MTLTAHERARRIKIILFDVDGVLTDGTIWLVPAPARPRKNPLLRSNSADPTAESASAFNPPP